MADQEIDHLEHLNLVSRVIIELENHFGLNNKEVAEFIIDLARDAGTFEKFKKALEEHDLAEGVSYPV
jgi:ATP-dependent RNA helicase DHX8/PRP22